MRSEAARERWLMLLLALLPVLAHAPAWWQGRLLGPGDGAALHLPLRSLIWQAWRSGELPSWNDSIFSGTPLLAAYRGGAFFPPVIALSWLEPFTAFQVLVLASLSSAAVLTFLYLRRLHACRLGAYVAGLSFALGPYLVGHLDDTATLAAAPLLPLALLAAESHMNRESPGRAAGLAAAVALLLLSGSPHAARAGAALVAGRVLVGYLFRGSRRVPRARTTLVALAAGVLLAAPQVLPTSLALREAGRQVTGLATPAGGEPPGLTGLVLRYVSHTPAPSLALAALPLALSQPAVRVLGTALALGLGLQWGRGPLSAPGAASLVFDFALAALAGLSLSAQWRARRVPAGRRLRVYFLLSSLASTVALSIAAATLGPLSQELAGAVGVLAVALILYFATAAVADGVIAGAWLLPLTVSFLLQPHARDVWLDAPTRAEWRTGTPTSRAVSAAMGARHDERTLTLVREWPFEEEADLAYAGRAVGAGRRSANGYDPMVPLRARGAYDGMSVAGTLPGAFFRSDPARLQLLGVRFVQVPASALVTGGAGTGLGETVDLLLEPGRPRLFPLPLEVVSEVRVVSWLADGVAVPDGAPVAQLAVRLATGREVPLMLRAGRETAEWAYDRPDVRTRVAHARPTVIDSFPVPGEGFSGHRYLGTLPLPGRYWVDGLRIERLAGPGRLVISRLGLADGSRRLPVSLVSGYVSDMGRFREVAVTPAVRLFEVAGSPGRAWVVERLRRLRDGEAVHAAVRSPTAAGLDPSREAVAVAADVAGLELPAAPRASRARIVHDRPGRIELRALGPGLLVVAEGWDRGWSARVDDRPARLVRVNYAEMGLALEGGSHRIVLRHLARGLLPGLGLAAVGLLLIASLGTLARGNGARSASGRSAA